jgi:CRISPR-associated protein Cas1
VAASLRGWEGAASKRYFSCIAELVPPFYQFEQRDRLPARDPFNATLNYAYGILYGKVEGALIKAGIDPYAGVFHRDDFNRPALVYDMIERYRTWMDFVVVSLCRALAFPEESFDRHPETGAVLLGPLAKRILIQSVDDYLHEVIQWQGKTLSRLSHMDQDAYKLAKEFLKSDNDAITG